MSRHPEFARDDIRHYAGELRMHRPRPSPQPRWRQLALFERLEPARPPDTPEAASSSDEDVPEIHYIDELDGGRGS
jgi:hypothetical protein